MESLIEDATRRETARADKLSHSRQSHASVLRIPVHPLQLHSQRNLASRLSNSPRCMPKFSCDRLGCKAPSFRRRQTITSIASVRNDLGLVYIISFCQAGRPDLEP